MDIEEIKKTLDQGRGYVIIVFQKEGSAEIFAEGYLNAAEILTACANFVEKIMGKHVLIFTKTSKVVSGSKAEQESGVEPSVRGFAG